MASDGASYVRTGERGDVRGLGTMEHVARGEGPRPAGPQGGVDGRSSGQGIELDARQDGELLVRDPVRGEDDEIAFEVSCLTTIEIPQFDCLHPPSAADRGNGGAGVERHAVADRGAEPEWSERLMTRLVGDHRDRLRTAVREGQQRGEADVLGADYDGTPARTLPVQVDKLLQGARGHHALWSRARDEPGRSGALPATTGQDDRSRIEGIAPARRGHGKRAVMPARRLRLGADLGAGRGRSIREPRGIGRSGHRAAQIADPEALMPGMTGDPAGLGLAIEDNHPTGTRATDASRRSEAGRATADDGDVADLPPQVLARHGVTPMISAALPSVSSARIEVRWAAQKNPWQRPISALVRRRRPSRSTGGTVLFAASRISPRLTLSQKHTTRPYSGSAAIASACAYGRGPASPMFGIRILGRPSGRSRRTSPDRPSSLRRCSAIAIDAVKPVDRIPPAHAYRSPASAPMT
jgi:hypothetical protein